MFKPWPNGLAKSIDIRFCVELAFRLATHLRRLSSTCDDCVDLCWLWSSSNLDASRRKFFLPFGHPAQVDTSWLQVICCYKNALTNDMCEIYYFLRLASRLANPFGYPSQVHTQVLDLQTCVDLRVRLARALGSFYQLHWFSHHPCDKIVQKAPLINLLDHS